MKSDFVKAMCRLVVALCKLMQYMLSVKLAHAEPQAALWVKRYGAVVKFGDRNDFPGGAGHPYLISLL